MKYGLTIVLALLLMVSCTTRQIREDYAGATEQRLTSHSINEIMDKLQNENLSILTDAPVFLECCFLKEIEPLAYARKRLTMDLVQKYHCRLVDDPAQAEFRLTVFFTAIGTDFDKLGITLPDLVVPVIGGVLSFDVIAYEMYHGVTEFYYYIQDSEDNVIAKSAMLKQAVRNDSLLLPFITIPITRMN